MHPIRKQRLLFVLAIVLVSGTAIALLAYALRENLNLFYPPSHILAGKAPVNTTIRAGGCVVPGSIKKASDSLKVNFKVTDGAAVLPVIYEGILPDLFAEGEAAVLTGRLQEDGVFLATEVLAKHDESYTPPAVADAVRNAKGGQNHAASCEGMNYGA